MSRYISSKTKSNQRSAQDAHPYRFICELCHFTTDRSARVDEHLKHHGPAQVRIFKHQKDHSIESLREGKRMGKKYQLLLVDAYFEKERQDTALHA